MLGFDAYKTPRVRKCWWLELLPQQDGPEFGSVLSACGLHVLRKSAAFPVNAPVSQTIKKKYARHISSQGL